jgi:hypothetical protein
MFSDPLKGQERLPQGHVPAAGRQRLPVPDCISGKNLPSAGQEEPERYFSAVVISIVYIARIMK